VGLAAPDAANQSALAMNLEKLKQPTIWDRGSRMEKYLEKQSTVEKYLS
jgi:hypothetical protein